MRSNYLLIVALLGVTACAPPVQVTSSPTQVRKADAVAAEAAVRDTLRDPASAQFRNLYEFDLSNGHNVVCGEVNAKNGFGGYNGFTKFYVRMRGTAIAMVESDTDGFGSASRACRDAASGSLSVAP